MHCQAGSYNLLVCSFIPWVIRAVGSVSVGSQLVRGWYIKNQCLPLMCACTTRVFIGVVACVCAWEGVVGPGGAQQRMVPSFWCKWVIKESCKDRAAVNVCRNTNHRSLTAAVWRTAPCGVPRNSAEQWLHFDVSGLVLCRDVLSRAVCLHTVAVGVEAVQFFSGSGVLRL
jgi:hypothetical protein